MEHKVLNHLGFIDTYQMAHNNCHPLGSIAPYGTRWYWWVCSLFPFMLSMLALARYTAQPFSKHSVDVNQNMCGMAKCTNNFYWPIAQNLLLFALPLVYIRDKLQWHIQRRNVCSCSIDNRFRIVSTVINAIWNKSGLNVVLDVHRL